MAPPKTVTVVFVGGPLCGAERQAFVGPAGLGAALLFPDGDVRAGRYMRTERLVTTATGAVRVAYQWRHG
jgi:hypothetical protein